MNECQETIAKALEIAIALTGAKHTSIRLDTNKNVFIDEPLYTTLKAVIRIMNDKLLLAISGECHTYSGRG